MDTALWVCGMSEPPQAACKAAPSGSVPAGRRGCRRVRGVAVVLLLAVGGLLAPPVRAQTVILVSNIEEMSSSTLDESTRIAQRFNTGRHADGYTLTNVAIRYADAAGDAFAAQVCAVQAVGTDQPDLSACTPLTLTGSFPMSSALSTVYFIGVIDLEPETKYTVVLTPATGATVTYGITTSDAETSKQDRWNIAGEYRIESGSDWNAQSGSSAFKIEVTGTITIPDALVSNIGTGGVGATGRDGVAVGDTSSATYIQAQKFRTGTHPAGYRLTGLRFYVDSLSSNNVTPQVSLYTAGSDGNPGTSLYVFTGTLTTTGYTTLVAPADATLEPDTDYFVHFEDTNHATVPDRGRYNVRRVASATEDTASQSGWSIADVQHQKENTDAWQSIGSNLPWLGIWLRGEAAGPPPPNRPPVFDEGSSAERELDETVADRMDGGGHPIGAALTATDADTDLLEYRLGGLDADEFEINAHTGQLETKADVRYDYEARPRYTVRVTADDSRGGTATLPVTIVIEDAYEPPERVEPPPTVEALSRTELRVSWMPPDNVGRPPITGYDLQWGDRGIFDTHTTMVRGTETTLTGLSPDTEYLVQVRATNADGPGPWSPLVSKRTEANNPPVFMEGTNTTRVLPETEGAAVVRTAAALGAALTASDADMDRLVYRLEAGQDAAKFSLDPSSGRLRTKVGERYDYEEQRSYTVTVMATDVFGGPARITVTITVGNAETEPPLAPVAPTVTSSDPTELEVTWTAPDNVGRPDIMHYDLQYRMGGTSNWTLLEDESGPRRTISGLVAATAYEVQVQAHNDDGASPWSPTGRGQTNTVSNAAPEIRPEDQARMLAETVGAATESPARDLDEPFTATDPDTDPLRYTLAGQAAGQFTLDGNTGQLRTRVGQRYDHEAGEERAVIVKVEDGQGGSAAALVTVTITDAPDLEPPLAPAAPRVTTATGPTPTLRVSWRAPNNVGRPRIDYYNLQYRANATDSWTAGPQAVVGTSEEITDLPTTTGYEVQVQAHNADGDSDWSPAGRRTTTRPPPPPSRGGGGGGSSRDDHGDTAAQATAVRVESSAPWGSSTAGQLNTTSDVDYFTLAVPQAGLLVVETTGATATRGTVWQDGVELGQAASGGERQNFRLSVPVEAGPVVIAVQSPGQRTGSYTLETRLVVGYLENPGPESFQSGVGVLSGWVCAADAVTIELNGAAQAAAYGTERLDTAAICGDTDNGFGLLFNWNLLGDGEHEVVAFVDGVELDRATVTVTTLGSEFVEDVAGTCTVPDFPTLGETVTLVWQQNSQNFVVAEGSPPAGATTGRTNALTGYLENPGHNSFQSGIGVLSGWVCAAETVEIVIGDLAPQEAGYGTERLDTHDACGDTNNGFGLLFNWNLLDDGEHAVVAYVDDMELGRATVRVTTLGEEFLRGVEGECVVEDFPLPGRTVTLAWQQNQQNFVITQVE